MEGRTSPETVYGSIIKRSWQTTKEIAYIALNIYFHPSRYPPQEVLMAEEMISMMHNRMIISDSYSIYLMMALIFFISEGFSIFPVKYPPHLPRANRVAAPRIPDDFERAINMNVVQSSTNGCCIDAAIYYLLFREQIFELKIFKNYTPDEFRSSANILFKSQREERISISLLRLDISDHFLGLNKWLSLALFFRKSVKKAFSWKIRQIRGDSSWTIHEDSPAPTPDR